MKNYETKRQDEMNSELSEQIETHQVEQSEDILETANKQEIEEIEQSVEEQVMHSYTVMDLPEERDEEDQSAQKKPPNTPNTREQLLTLLSFGGVVLLGAILRFWGLGDKPLHHDESQHAYFSLPLMHQFEHLNLYFTTNPPPGYRYLPVLHGPFQFHAIAFVYKVSQLLGAPDNGVNTTTVRIAAATLGSLLVLFPFFLRDYLGKIGAWIACLLLAVSPGMVYFSRFAREDIYMACFTLLMVVAVARYLRDRTLRWLVIAAAAFMLSYATKEATFLSIAIFGSFVAGLIAWEIGLKWKIRSAAQTANTRRSLLPRNAAPFTLLAFVILGGIATKYFFAWLKSLSLYITNPNNTAAADLYVEQLKSNTVVIALILSLVVGIFAIGKLIFELNSKPEPRTRRGLAARIDPSSQRLLDTILTMPWFHWFIAILTAWAIFLFLFTVIFTNVVDGIGSGIWQGLYYWLQQQQVARGGQPWYYYLLLIPLYEQIGVVFGLVGIVRCIAQPTRFRLFMVYWFVGNLMIYSWAAEKMPWLMIHMVIPMLILAAIGLEPVVVTVIALAKNLLNRARHAAKDIETSGIPVSIPQPRPGPGVFGGSSALVGFVLAVLLLFPTLHNMYEVSYVHAADGPHEMMVYVQTTPDVNTVMQKIDQLDQKLYHGQHLLPIGIMLDAQFPFLWYVRDYTNVCLNYPDGCPTTAKDYPVIITGGTNLYTAVSQYTDNNGKVGNYLFHQYHMRTWWDEGYKPPPCVPSATQNCDGQPDWGGVGPALWLSYGDNPPQGATFNLGKAVQNIWNWWWDRRAIGDTGGTYDMGLFIRKDAGVTQTHPTQGTLCWVCLVFWGSDSLKPLNTG